jgi:hypothetical protein
MTFVNQAEVEECAQSMIGHLRDKFPRKSVLSPDGHHDIGLEVGHFGRMKATVALRLLQGSLYVNLVVSESAGIRFGETCSDFPFVQLSNGNFAYCINVSDQASAERVERRIKRLLALHMCCSR